MPTEEPPSGAGAPRAGDDPRPLGGDVEQSRGDAEQSRGDAARPRFHLAFPVPDLEAARGFYAGFLGCRVGRESERWIDFDFAGHQVTAHLAAAEPQPAVNPVDGDAVPVRHFGLILPWAEWEALVARLRDAGTAFLIAPHVRFRGEVGEQATLFVRDPGGNCLEFKAFRDPRRIFAR